MRTHYNRLLMFFDAVLLCTSGCMAPDPGPALDIPIASSAAAEACATKLPPVAEIIYRDAAPDVHTETNLESLLRVKVLMLIVRDQIKRGEARTAAEQAAECLEMLKR